jgi:hypothetical protein
MHTADTLKTIISETHSLHAQANGKIQLVIELEPEDRKKALHYFSKPGAALAVVRLPSVFDRCADKGYCRDEDDDEILLH